MRPLPCLPLNARLQVLFCSADKSIVSSCGVRHGWDPAVFPVHIRRRTCFARSRFWRYIDLFRIAVFLGPMY
jgi:hypothetical protein